MGCQQRGSVWNWRFVCGIVIMAAARNLLFAPWNKWQGGEQQIPHGLKAVCVNCVVPEGTRIYFPLHPALRPRLRAGLNYFAPTALDFRPSSSTNKYQVWFSPMLKRPFVMTTQNRETGHYYAAPNYLATLDPSNRSG